MKILVTGSKGVIGSKLVRNLKAREHHVFGLDLFHTNDHYGHGVGKKTEDEYFRCDISEYRQSLGNTKEYDKDEWFDAAVEFDLKDNRHQRKNGFFSSNWYNFQLAVKEYQKSTIDYMYDLFYKQKIQKF